ncbi:MAG: peroxide stress protein YaaA [Bacteroidales bacterium]|nr:peroxide stress protein YaaA [Bacteroidales bacterium]
MLTILGPAKTINRSPHGVTDLHCSPQYLDQAEELVDQLRQYSISQLKSMMKVSDKLATLTFERYAAWRSSYSADEGLSLQVWYPLLVVFDTGKSRVNIPQKDGRQVKLLKVVNCHDDAGCRSSCQKEKEVQGYNRLETQLSSGTQFVEQEVPGHQAG